ncbi:MAG: endonuclease domain-containing protein [Asticcacaulis sp.]
MKLPRKHQFAKRLRKAMSPPEVRLWLRLRPRTGGTLTFRRQHPIGPYVLDFYCAAASLAIEVDGLEHTYEENRKRDTRRDSWLLAHGIYTHRIPAIEIMANADEAAEGVFRLAFERAL